ncbi:membrane-associated progesterone-binding protein 4 isoform X3 [Citrus clementina]|uniref:membrane-associated progesterone-binding protein 4 isoform X3 n=1 Tax=Citrus clementina TaxID=85681 RepID=UPI000CED79EA|nr:membrane-associated progesterone-binding protein 4 isoform X3 [Citrus x clementina]
MVVKKIISSPFVAIAVLVTLVAVIFRFSPKLLLSRQQRLFTAEELALHNGTDESIPILLGILGSVFDVTKGKSHYGVGGGYNHFAGRSVKPISKDASRAFVSGNFTGDGLTDSLRGLSSTEVKSIVEWREFYFRSYTFVGKLVGRYYDNQGNATKYLKGAEAKAARGAQLLEKQKAEEAKQPGCNSRWSQDEGGEVWCDTGFPRLVQRPLEIALTGKMSKRCACFLEDQLDQQGLEVYEGCDYLAQTCRV